MLPLSEIHAVRTTVDDEWRSPVADAVAARWGIPPGAARYWRSSASHVFVVPPGVDDRGVLYVRFVPAALRSRRSVEAPAALLAAVGAQGGVVEPLPSLDGALVETVRTPSGDAHAVVVPEAPGREHDVDDLTPQGASDWGAALARFHLAAAPHAALVSDVAGAAATGSRNGGDPWATLALRSAEAGDDALAEAAVRLSAPWGQVTQRLPGGVLHGDFELDNVRGEGRHMVAFDVDETCVGPYVLDVAVAVRDLVGTGTVDDPRYPALLAAFLEGYGRTRPVLDAERHALALSGPVVAARSLVHGHGVLDAGDAPDDPGWLAELRRRLDAHHDQARKVVLAASSTLD
ncbi:Ser/Thr protein kinase RdoA involved in Cpx stress response, MazF antagonist [Cellulosimicrobium aquatile]|uniref:Ser/Thr protein kinase RdoA involved in Cpx stress response, MazF antagonist n=1 Tax=Cellulosimicrobium aquatile TaxID=1612203 RepID=A0A1N6WCM8_9MICO|nr:phosphotransferase [Cellulosimicrobium aquatile]NMF30410.1 aminoglycoside phosphotransferase [Cellulosimicrobium aquatile]SIQ87782.1 Ser/Thr protein kinase RdoA involved in Cpx stress response, MazF antagonist [Cellulosimicrobium aquatile]